MIDWSSSILLSSGYFPHAVSQCLFVVVPYRHRLMVVCHMADGKKYPSLLTKNVDRAGLNPLMSLPSQSCDRGLRQIIPTPISLQSCSGGTSPDVNPVHTIVSAILFTIYRL